MTVKSSYSPTYEDMTILSQIRAYNLVLRYQKVAQRLSVEMKRCCKAKV